MNITVNRVTSDNDSTISTIEIDGEFECFGLEDEYREGKIIGETRIPAGRYKIGLRTTGGFHARYSKLFPTFHRGMLQVMCVPNFEHVLIHIGNTDDDTSGCLLVGSGCDTRKGNMYVSTSSKAYKDLYEKVIDAALEGGLWIEYIDND